MYRTGVNEKESHKDAKGTKEGVFDLGDLGELGLGTRRTIKTFGTFGTGMGAFRLRSTDGGFGYAQPPDGSGTLNERALL